MKRNEQRKLIIIGAGPAGLSAGIYSARAGLEPLIIENGLVGGQMSGSSIVENYPGIPEISGQELAALMKRQALRQGAVLSEFDPFVRADFSDREKLIETENCVYHAEAVIIAAGAEPKPLPLENEKQYRGRGLHYCALCDGSAYTDMNVGIVGGGSAALEDALYLAKLCRSVTIIRRRDSFHAEQRLIDAVTAEPKIRILYNTELIAVGGDKALEYAEVKHDNIIEKIPLCAIFCRLGSTPKSEPFSDFIRLSESGYIPTDLHMATNLGGVFAAGDIREKECRQIVTAVSDGAIAALSAEKWLTQ